MNNQTINESEALSIVDEHRKMLLLSGQLSDFQTENLQKWPYVLFDDELEKVVITYDFKSQESINDVSKISAGKVKFDFIFKNNTKIDGEKKERAVTHLTIWTKFLFWENTKVDIFRNGKKWI